MRTGMAQLGMTVHSTMGEIAGQARLATLTTADGARILLSVGAAR